MKNELAIWFLGFVLSVQLRVILNTPIPVEDVEKYRKPCQEKYTWAEQKWKYRITRIVAAELVYIKEPDHRFPYHNQTHIKTHIVRTNCRKEDPKDADKCPFDPKDKKLQKFKLAVDKKDQLQIFIDNTPN